MKNIILHSTFVFNVVRLGFRLVDLPAIRHEYSKRQHNKDERDDESQGHDEWIEFWRRHRVVKKALETSNSKSIKPANFILEATYSKRC